MNVVTLLLIVLSPLWALAVVRTIRSTRRKVQALDARRRLARRLLATSVVAHVALFWLPEWPSSALMQLALMSLFFAVYGVLFTGIALLERSRSAQH